MATFGQTLLALKIYNTRYVHYRFSALIASARTQPMIGYLLSSRMRCLISYTLTSKVPTGSCATVYTLGNYRWERRLLDICGVTEVVADSAKWMLQKTLQNITRFLNKFVGQIVIVV